MTTSYPGRAKEGSEPLLKEADKGKPGTPLVKQKRSGHTRRRLLEAAMKQLEQHGIGQLTVANVVERANSSIGAFMYHFETKEDLLLALIDLYHVEKTKALEAKFEGFRVRDARDVSYFLGEIEGIQISYYRNVSNDFYISQRSNLAIREKVEAITGQNDERSRQLFARVFGTALEENKPVEELIFDFVNVHLRGATIAMQVYSDRALQPKLEYWRNVYADLICKELGI